ncbi:MAG TPA: hypothetical protein ENO21_04285, partial [Firmicutes bacterium]|nr:hypothetical protein [Bacillota bacterium]
MSYSRQIALPLALLILTCSLSACGGETSTTPAEEQHHADDGQHSELVLGENLLQVKMRPADSVDPPFTAGELAKELSTPAALTTLLPPVHTVSFEEQDLVKAGVKYEALLPSNRVAPDGGDPNAVEFNPDWQNGLEGAAYCIYRFPLADYGASTREQTLGFQFAEKLPADPPVYIGYGDVKGHGGWAWYQAESDGILTIESYEQYEYPDGSVLIAFVVLGDTPLVLQELVVGAFEVRGTGGDDPVAFTPAQPLWPDFPLQAQDMVDLSPFAGPVGDQDGSASCTAWAATGACQYELATLYGDCGWDLDLPAFRLSPRFVYIRMGSGADSCPGGGRPIYGAATWIRDNGAAREVTAPFFT